MPAKKVTAKTAAPKKTATKKTGVSTSQSTASKKKSASRAAVKKANTSRAASPKKVAAPKMSPKPTLPSLLLRILDVLEEKKAENIVVLDMRSLSSLADYYVLASGTSSPHLRSLSNELSVTLKKEGTPARRRDGTPESGWMAVDYTDVIVHIMGPDVREFYGIEELWSDAPRVTRS